MPKKYRVNIHFVAKYSFPVYAESKKEADKIARKALQFSLGEFDGDDDLFGRESLTTDIVRVLEDKG